MKDNSSNDIEVKKKITFADIRELVENFERTYPKREGVPKNTLNLLKAIFEIYSEHIEKQKNKHIDLSIDKNRPAILRSELIRRYGGGSELEGGFYTDKSRLNNYLRRMIFDFENGKSLNPKCLVLKRATSGKGETSNYFITIRKPEIAPAKAIGYNYSIDQRLKANLEKWKSSNYLGEYALSITDLNQIPIELNPAEYDDESIAYIMISAIFRQKYDERWWKYKKKIIVIWHMINLLPQGYRRPYWRVAFLLQCINSTLLTSAVSKFPETVINIPQVKQALIHIKKKTVQNYLLKCIKEKSSLVVPYEKDLLWEFRDFDCHKLNQKKK